MQWQSGLLCAAAAALLTSCSIATTTTSRVPSAEQKAQSAARSKALVSRTISPPASWIAAKRRWSPRRHFGPLYGNSPDLHLDGNVATFVYNQFFAGHPDAAVFQKYYGGTLPQNAPTLPQAVPGAFPNGDGFRDLRFGFEQLTYSSRYGGSFRLTFVSLEDFQVEYRKGADLWDIGSLQLNVYVRPVAGQFNPPAPISTGVVWLEFVPQQVTGYTLDPGTNTIFEKPGDPMPALAAALADTARTMRTAGVFAREAARFAHGLVHSAFWTEIGQNNTVNGLEISDGFFLPRTSAGIPAAVVLVRLADVRLDTEPGDEEIHPTLLVDHVFASGNQRVGPTFDFSYQQINARGSTGWRTVGVFPIPFECNALQSVILHITFREEDAGLDDRFRTSPRTVETGPLECSAMQTAFNNGMLGRYKDLPDRQVSIVNYDDEVEGAANVQVRVTLIRQ